MHTRLQKKNSQGTDEGTAYISLLKKNAAGICTQSKELLQYLNNRRVGYDGHGTAFLEVLFYKNARLESEFPLFLSRWDQYHEKIWICSIESVCKDSEKREQYEKAAQDISRTCSVIKKYQQLTKKYDDTRREKITDGPDGITADQFLSSEESVDILQEARALLEDLSKKCEQICEFSRD